MISGNFGKKGCGVMPLRGQNNVQGACDMGMLPYFDPDYKTPFIEVLKTPDIMDKMIEGEINALLNMGEDITHIHSNQNKIEKAMQNLELIIVNEVANSSIAKRADILFGVKSGYEKEGVYINAERRLHLSTPLTNCDMPDDWEVYAGISKYLGKDFGYKSSKDVWNEVRGVAKERFAGASYERLKENSLKGLQWPIHAKDTPRLHIKRFKTSSGKATFRYKRYFLRGELEEKLGSRVDNGFWLSSGRNIVHYNNAAQTLLCEKLSKRESEDIILASSEDREFFKSTKVELVSKYGRSAPLNIKFTNFIKKGKLFVTFHHYKSKINYLFGDECDELTKTAAFKAIKVYVEFCEE